MINTLTDINTECLISIARSLISMPSFSGEEQNVVTYLSEVLSKSGFELHCDKFGSLIAILKGNKKGPTILFDGHIDTVRVENPKLWKHSPFESKIAKDTIYGRGASDMKGQDSAFLAAALRFKEEHGTDFSGTLALSFSVEEELFEGVACREISSYVNPDYVVIGEATDNKVNIGQRGRAEIELTVFGKSCHSANPEKGINAITEAYKALEALKSLKVKQDPILGENILVPTDIISYPYPGSSVIPEKVVITFDKRLITGDSEESIVAEISSCLKGVANFEVKVRKGVMKCYTGHEEEFTRFFPSWILDRNCEYVKTVEKALKAIGQKAIISEYSFCTNGSHFAGEKGIKTIGYGPSKENLAHTVDEYIKIEDLISGSLGYQAIMEAILLR